jgi:predicted nuclease of restriction endonuclease-like (RecB) superfamily
MSAGSIGNADYAAWVGELKTRIRSARVSAARSVNRELILLYWDIGRGIVEKQEQLGWGRSVVDRLAVDLQKEFPGLSGFSASNLWRMRQFCRFHSQPEFLAQAARELGLGDEGGQTDEFLAQVARDLLAEVPWWHHVETMAKVKEPDAHYYYLHAARQFGWSRNVLLNQIQAGAYERTLSEGKMHNFPQALSENLAEQAEETLKSSYNLEFLGIGREVKEREMEDRLVERLKDFMLELGYGFCFIGRQYRLVLGKKEYFIDLLFYHRFLKCLVAVELKVGEFQPEYAGKMDFYLNVLNDRERGADDNPSLGIILCAEKDDLEVEFALKSKTNPIGVAEYQLKSTLPKDLKGKIPSPKDFSRALGLPEKKKR